MTHTDTTATKGLIGLDVYFAYKIMLKMTRRTYNKVDFH